MKSHAISNPLLVSLYRKMNDERRSAAAVARELGISPSYFSQLINSERDVENVSDSFIRQSALYLRLPVVTCFVLAGRLRYEDFFSPSVELQRCVDAALQVVAASKYAVEIPLGIDTLLCLPDSAKLTVVEMFEALESVKLLPDRVRAEALLKICSSQQRILVNKC